MTTTIDTSVIKGFEVTSSPLWEVARHAGDGYDRSDVVEAEKWAALGNWGKDGWDLWRWPHQMVYIRREPNGFGVATNVEGDSTQYHADTREERDLIIDVLFVWFWQFHTCDRPEALSVLDGIVDIKDVPADLRGPYRTT